MEYPRGLTLLFPPLLFPPLCILLLTLFSWGLQLTPLSWGLDSHTLLIPNMCRWHLLSNVAKPDSFSHPLPPPCLSSSLLTNRRPSIHSHGPKTQQRPRSLPPFPHPSVGLARSFSKAHVTCFTSSPLVQGCEAFSSAQADVTKRWTGRLEQQVYILMVLEAAKSRIKVTVKLIADGIPSRPADSHLVTAGERERESHLWCPFLFL